MKRNTLLAALFFALSIANIVSAQTQELKRKASLGIQMMPITDSISEANKTKKGKGVFVLNVVPNSTASTVRMTSNSVLLKINGNEVNDFTMLRKEINDLRDGDQISLTFTESGKIATKIGKAVPRPLESFEHANIYYDQVNYKGNQLRSILYTPKHVNNPPVVYFLQGLPCQSTEYAGSEEISLMKMIQDWVLAGYAVYRVEKPGMGDSKCDKGCFELNFEEEVEGFKQGYIALQKNELIDAKNIFLFGHSLGGIIAPILAKELKPKGVMTYGTLVNSWFEYLQELTRIQGEMFNSPFEEIERDLRRSTPFWYQLMQLMVEKKTNLEILEDENISKMLEEEGILEEFRNGYFSGRHYTYWPTLNQVSLYTTWLEVESNVLAIYGEFDIQALNANHVKTIASIVNSKHPGNATYKVIDNADHGFVYFESMAENVNSLNTGQYGARLMDSYHSGIALNTIQWMNRLINK